MVGEVPEENGTLVFGERLGGRKWRDRLRHGRKAATLGMNEPPRRDRLLFRPQPIRRKTWIMPTKRSLIAASVLLLSLPAMTACDDTENHAAASPQPLIIDTDVGSDDALALVYMLQDPGVDVRAITVSGTGLVHCDSGVAIVAGLVRLAEHPQIPVVCGSASPRQDSALSLQRGATRPTVDTATSCRRRQPPPTSAAPPIYWPTCFARASMTSRS